MSEDQKLQAIRAQLPAVENAVYMNTGSVGPLPKVAAEAMEATLIRERDEGRITKAAFVAGHEAHERARKAVAGVIGADPEEVALTHCTTEGLNVVVWGLDWQPGDEIIITNLEHPAVFVPAWAVQQRFGAVVKTVDLGLGERDALAAFRAALGPRTRLVMFSHVAFCTGAALPVRDIVRLAHERETLVAVDGAQSVGAIPVDMADLGVDFYAIPGQKWLLGPEDTGALYVRRNRVESLKQTFVGYRSMAQQVLGTPLVPHPDARRFEVGSRNTPSIVGQAASLAWLAGDVGLDWATARVRDLTAKARAALQATRGVSVITPANSAGLLSFTVEGVAPAAVVEHLAAQGVIVRSIRGPQCVRASIAFFNTVGDVERLAAAVASSASPGS
ncbi:MAG: aminotransferase class V-fold PLP-dependent enzyme [Chloroflexota bacterium]